MAMMAGGSTLPRNRIPVSYTHLDVYKRQDRKYVCSAHDLDYACYAVCTQHHHRFSGVFSDMAHQRADHAGILSQIGLA